MATRGRTRLLGLCLVLLTLVPATALAARQSISPVAIGIYRGTDPVGKVKFTIGFATNHLPDGRVQECFGISRMRFATRCSRKLTAVPGAIKRSFVLRGAPPKRISFKYRVRGFVLRGYIGALNVRGTLRVTIPRCRGVFPFTAHATKP